jgi:GntR family transcriptional regulator
MDSGIIISQSDKRPIYLQIIEQVKRRIALGDWTEGQPIPSIRQLAVDLQVSVITVKRAYLELEREG